MCSLCSDSSSIFPSSMSKIPIHIAIHTRQLSMGFSGNIQIVNKSWTHLHIIIIARNMRKIFRLDLWSFLNFLIFFNIFFENLSIFYFVYFFKLFNFSLWGSSSFSSQSFPSSINKTIIHIHIHTILLKRGCPGKTYISSKSRIPFHIMTMAIHTTKIFQLEL